MTKNLDRNRSIVRLRVRYLANHLLLLPLIMISHVYHIQNIAQYFIVLSRNV